MCAMIVQGAVVLGQGHNWWVWGAIAALIILAMVLSYVSGLNRRLRKLSARLESQLAERKLVEEALATSEAFYHSLVEHLPLNIIRKDTEGRFTFGNPKFCEEIKRPLEELAGKTDFDLFPAHLAEKYRADDQRVMAGREPLEAIEEHDPGDGHKLYVQVIKTPVLDSSGKTVGVQGIFWDVTQRRRAEEGLRKNEQRTRLIVDTATDAFVEMDSDGRITAWNPAAEQVFGWTRDEAVGRLVRETIVPEPYREGHEHGLAHFLQTGRQNVLNRRFEISALRRDGSEFPIEITISPIRLGDAWFFAAFIHDITSRIEREEELRLSRERFDLAVRGSNDGIWDWDVRSGEVYFSPRWKSMIGYEENEIGNQFEEWEKRLHPDDHDRALATVQAYLGHQSTDYELEHRLRHKDGTYRWILARGVALFDAEGRAYRMAGSHTDITVRKEAERTLVQQEKLAGLGQMVAGVAHEINNPLAFVANNVAVLQRDVRAMSELLAAYMKADPAIAQSNPAVAAEVKDLSERFDAAYTLPNLEELLVRSRDGLKRIQQIVHDLRDFARLDSSDMHEVDLNEGVESTINIIRGRAKRKQVAIEMHLSELPPVNCYPAKINQVIMNLLANAIDACNEGGRVDVTTRTASTDDGEGAVEIEVSDCGCGIDPAVREKIFDPFFTTKPPGEGTGLGLSISYGIVQDHGGSIRVESEKGHGAVFTVRIPTNGHAK
jgi:PAS domain S-box-containing protein